MEHKNIIVVPDVHFKSYKIEKYLSRITYNKVIFLGDYFDSHDPFFERREFVEETAEWLKSSLKDPRRVHLFGNHDLHYISPTYGCSGFTSEKYKLISSIIPYKDWNRLHFYHFEYFNDIPYLFTHAGLSNVHIKFDRDENFYENLIRELNSESNYIKDGIDRMDYKHSWITECGPSRSQTPVEQEAGGLVWCDIDEFQNVPEIFQVFGHTVQCMPSGPITIAEIGKNNMCIDSHLRVCLHIGENGERELIGL